MSNILEIKQLSLSFIHKNGQIHALRNASIQLKSNQSLAIVGESGCGKSTLAKALLKLHPSQSVVYNSGQIIMEDEDILPFSEKQMQQIRGKIASIVFQNHATSLNPTMKIKKQIIEAIQAHRPLSKQECEAEALKLLTLVQLRNPQKCLEQYAHELSGGMRQRVVIAIALASQPKILLLDEPTTSLDVTIQAQIMNLIAQLKKQLGMSIILITHDLSLAKSFCSHIAVMYAGEVVESGSIDDVLNKPHHPYTKALLGCQLSVTQAKQERLTYLAGMPPLLSQLPQGCAFHERCQQCMEICLEQAPKTIAINSEHNVNCFLYHPDYVEEE